MALKCVNFGFQITSFWLISFRSIWHWLYNNNSLSVLYELIGQTLTLWFQAKPADKGNFTLVCIKILCWQCYKPDVIWNCKHTRLNAKHMKGILLRIAHLHHHNLTLGKKLKNFLQLVAPIFTPSWILLTAYGSQFNLLLYFLFYWIIYWSLL